VTDAKKAFLEVDDYKLMISNLAQTTLREVLNDMDLDEPTDEWGARRECRDARGEHRG
jgi:regulator of protease activity HflC (stomatin/prohibitin superfamily)